MSAKQDRHGVRTAVDLERKYNFGKTFAEVLGIATDAQKAVGELEQEVLNQMAEQYTAMIRDSTQIVMSALNSYVEKDDYEELERTVQTQFEQNANDITMQFSTIVESIKNVNGELQEWMEKYSKHIRFSDEGIIINSGDDSVTIQLDNEEGVVISRNGTVRSRLQDDEFYTGNIVVEVDERAQFGNFAYIPRSDKSLTFRKVGG